ncbi:biotin operon repressor / biotin-protein ligase [hydrocarbon metagenome]|uniref:Biotin operon repressor / biotin-protein ligase n=1 Tax=hydrocarbon metagenome TaxID=938273 RepID=A0A0W8E442_9ZZZZ
MLLNEGYEVESSPRKGYRLSVPADILSPDEVRPGLATEAFGQQDYFYYREIDSTNNRARILASEGYPEGTVVVAEMQTAGRGRRGRCWYSPANQGIYISVILRPVLPLKEISRISLVTAVAVAETMQSELHLQPRIKWPNDILIQDKKIAGILSEAVTDIDGIEYIVVGIGLNINNQIPDFPSDFRTPATSVRAEHDRPDSRIKVLQGLLLHLETYYKNLLAGKFTHTLKKARSLSMVIGQEVRLDTVNGFITGQAVDIDNNGYLLVRSQQGIIHTIMSGEISILSSEAGE